MSTKITENVARRIAETLRDSEAKLVNEIEFLASRQSDLVGADETIVDRVADGLAPIIAAELAPVMDVLREALTTGTHSIDCPASHIGKQGRFTCSCWVSRAREIVGEG